MKPSDPLLLADVTLRCGVYPAGKVDISTPSHPGPGFPQSYHTVGKPSADAGSLCSEAWPQVILKCQPPTCLDYRSAQLDPASHSNFRKFTSMGENSLWQFSIKVWPILRNSTDLCKQDIFSLNHLESRLCILNMFAHFEHSLSVKMLIYKFSLKVFNCFSFHLTTNQYLCYR